MPSCSALIAPLTSLSALTSTATKFLVGFFAAKASLKNPVPAPISRLSTSAFSLFHSSNSKQIAELLKSANL